MVTGTTMDICSPAGGALGPLTSGAQPGQYDFSETGPIPTNPPYVFGSSPCGLPLPQYSPTPTVDVTSGLKNQELNYAAFTQETFSITDRVRFTAGGRLQYEKADRAPTYE